MEGQSLTNIYLDHKIANESSTIVLTLTMGLSQINALIFLRRLSCTVYGDGPSKGFPGLCQYHFSNMGEFAIRIKKFYYCKFI